jgi:5-methylcytosine-specific restriction protein A
MKKTKAAALPDWSELRHALLGRCRNRCEHCGKELLGRWEANHRRARGMGGTRRGDVHSLSNLTALHPRCHAWLTEHPAAGRDLGQFVRQHEDPAVVPLRLFGATPVLLTPDGRYAPVAAAHSPAEERTA